MRRKKRNSIKFKSSLVKVSFSKDEKEILLVSGSDISIWNRKTNKIKRIVTHRNYQIVNAFYSKSERYILYFLGTSVYIWDKKTQESKKIITHKYSISGALFDNNETKVISWSNYNRDKTLRVWDKKNGERIITKYKYSDNYGSKVILSDNGQFVVSWDSDAQDGSNYGIYAQIFNLDGSRQGSEFQVSTYRNNYQIIPSITELGSDKFIISYHKNS